MPSIVARIFMKSHVVTILVVVRHLLAHVPTIVFRAATPSAMIRIAAQLVVANPFWITNLDISDLYRMNNSVTTQKCISNYTLICRLFSIFHY